jgi:hypothetical protein
LYSPIKLLNFVKVKQNVGILGLQVSWIIFYICSSIQYRRYAFLLFMLIMENFAVLIVLILYYQIFYVTS